MPTTLASRAALFVLTAAFLIPIWTSALGGLTHVLSCREEVRTPFSILLAEEDDATVISATTVTRAEAEKEPEGTLFSLCDGLAVELRGNPVSEGQVEMGVSVTNQTAYPWQGTILFRAGTTPIPVDIGKVEPQETETDVVRFALDPGQHELTGSLLIGP